MTRMGLSIGDPRNWMVKKDAKKKKKIKKLIVPTKNGTFELSISDFQTNKKKIIRSSVVSPILFPLCLVIRCYQKKKQGPIPQFSQVICQGHAGPMMQVRPVAPATDLNMGYRSC